MEFVLNAWFKLLQTWHKQMFLCISRYAHRSSIPKHLEDIVNFTLEKGGEYSPSSSLVHQSISLSDFVKWYLYNFDLIYCGGLLGNGFFVWSNKAKTSGLSEN